MLLFCACKSDYEMYADTDTKFRQLNYAPDVTIVVKREAGIYYKIIHFEMDWEFLNGIYEGKSLS